MQPQSSESAVRWAAGRDTSPAQLQTESCWNDPAFETWKRRNPSFGNNPNPPTKPSTPNPAHHKPRPNPTQPLTNPVTHPGRHWQPNPTPNPPLTGLTPYLPLTQTPYLYPSLTSLDRSNRPALNECKEHTHIIYHQKRYLPPRRISLGSDHHHPPSNYPSPFKLAHLQKTKTKPAHKNPTFSTIHTHICKTQTF